MAAISLVGCFTTGLFRFSIYGSVLLPQNVQQSQHPLRQFNATVQTILRNVCMRRETDLVGEKSDHYEKSDKQMIEAFRGRFFLIPFPHRNLSGNENSAVSMYHKFHTLISTGIEERMESCTELKSVKHLHAHILVAGLHKNTRLAAKLVIMYTKLRGLADARLIFYQMYDPPLSVWNILIKENSTKEALVLYNRMRQAGKRPDHFTFPIVLKACGKLSALQTGKAIHYHILRCGLESHVFVGNALIDMYAKCGCVEDAREVFDEMSDRYRDVVSWTAMISGYARTEHAEEALALFHQMQLQNVMPDSVTMVCVLSACGTLGALEQGKLIHGQINMNQLDSDIFITTALVDMYAKCGDVAIANQLFEKMSRKDVVAWNAMLAGYAKNGQANEAIMFFNQMQLSDAMPNLISTVNLLSACAHLGAVQQGMGVHTWIIKRGFESSLVVGTALIDMYAKCQSIDIARLLFEKMSFRNVVSWSAMIAGYVQNGLASDALVLFEKMQLEDMKPNSVTMVSVLSACAHLAALEEGKCLHHYMVKNGLELDISVGNSLLDMYAKCGSLSIARSLFDKMSKRDVISWNAMIAAYGMHGHGVDALALFNEMLEARIEPNHITFVSVLSACSHAGLVDLGRKYFSSMSREYNITPSMKHYVCMVDLFGRAGNLEEAENVIKTMPLEPDIGVWGAMLGACRIHSNIQLGEYAAKKLYELESADAGYYVLMSNIYAAAGKWDDVAKVRELMKVKMLKKTPGCSWIEANNKIHTFLSGDKSHPQSEKIYLMLVTLIEKIEKVGYVPDTNFVLHDVDEKVKKRMLYSHSEKLAIAFGLIHINFAMPIRIAKNLRVCGDCHNASKLISKIVQREIIVRDANRFHHFKNGFCSCGDFW